MADQPVVLRLGSTFPNLSVKTTHGDFSLHQWKGDSWMLFFSHPRDFTPVCTTEVASLAADSAEFEKRNVKLIGLSCDSVEDHNAWSADIFSYCEKACGKKLSKLPFPLIGDSDRKVAKALGMIDPDESASVGIPLTCRAVFIVGPDNLLKLFIYYPATTGRNFVEMLRVVDSLQMTAQKKVATPANWKKGDKMMITPAATEDEAKKLDPNYEVIKVPSDKKYLKLAQIS